MIEDFGRTIRETYLSFIGQSHQVFLYFKHNMSNEQASTLLFKMGFDIPLLVVDVFFSFTCLV